MCVLSPASMKEPPAWSCGSVPGAQRGAGSALGKNPPGKHASPYQGQSWGESELGLGCTSGIAREQGQKQVVEAAVGWDGLGERPESSVGLEETLGDPSCCVLAVLPVPPRWPRSPLVPVLPPSTSVRAGKLRHGAVVACLFGVSANTCAVLLLLHRSLPFQQSLGWCQDLAAHFRGPSIPPSSVPVPSQQMPDLLSGRKNEKQGKKNKKTNTLPNNMRKKCWCVLGGLVETPCWIPPKGGARAGSRPPAGPAAFFLDSLAIWALNFSLKRMYL